MRAGAKDRPGDEALGRERASSSKVRRKLEGGRRWAGRKRGDSVKKGRKEVEGRATRAGREGGENLERA